MYSKTMNGPPSCSPRSITATMFGCESPATSSRLPPEAVDDVGLGDEPLVQHLERDRPLEHPVVRAVDARHPAGADELLELVAVRDDVAGHQWSFASPGRNPQPRTASSASSQAPSASSSSASVITSGTRTRMQLP